MNLQDWISGKGVGIGDANVLNETADALFLCCFVCVRVCVCARVCECESE